MVEPLPGSQVSPGPMRPSPQAAALHFEVHAPVSEFWAPLSQSSAVAAEAPGSMLIPLTPSPQIFTLQVPVQLLVALPLRLVMVMPSAARVLSSQASPGWRIPSPHPGFWHRSVQVLVVLLLLPPGLVVASKVPLSQPSPRPCTPSPQVFNTQVVRQLLAVVPFLPPSSHCSRVAVAASDGTLLDPLTPSPQVFKLHVLLHSSVPVPEPDAGTGLLAIPSSHCSPVFTVPFPQLAGNLQLASQALPDVPFKVPLSQASTPV